MVFKWDFVMKIIPTLMQGAILTVELTALSVLIGSVIGLFAAMCRISKNSLLKGAAGAYITFFRGTPLLVQIVLIHYGLPMVFADTVLSYVPNAFTSAIVALSINSGAYIAEIFRGGIQSIDRGQMEAARSLGMSYVQAMRFVVLPQAFKRSIPPLGNEFIALLKDSSLVTIISLEELMTKGSLIIGRTPRPLETWITVALIYLIMTVTISKWVDYMERRLKTNDQH